MSRFEKLVNEIVRGNSDHNIHFNELQNLLLKLGFEQRIKGSHHVFSKVGILEIINIQPAQGQKCKPYQVKQVRDLIVKYKLTQLIK